MKRNLSWILISLSAGMVLAEETPPPAVSDQGWKASAGASALLNTGNSSSQTLGGNALTAYRLDQNKVEWTGNGAYGRARDNLGVSSTNTKNWRTQLRYDRFIFDPVSLFALGHLGADEPAGFDLRYGGAAGLSHEIWKTDPDFFKYEVGFDYTHEERIAPPDADLYSGRLFLQYKRKISTWATFGQDVESLFNLQEGRDIRLNALTSLTMKLTDKVAFQAGYAVRFDNVPVPGKKKVDTTTQMGIVVNFL